MASGISGGHAVGVTFVADGSNIDRMLKRLGISVDDIKNRLEKGIQIPIDFSKFDAVNKSIDSLLETTKASLVATETLQKAWAGVSAEIARAREASSGVAAPAAAGAVAAAAPAAVVAAVAGPTPGQAAATGAMASNLGALGAAAEGAAQKTALTAEAMSSLEAHMKLTMGTKDRLIANIGHLNVSLAAMGHVSENVGQILTEEFNRSIEHAAHTGLPEFVGVLESVNTVFNKTFVESMKASAAIQEGFGEAIPRAFDVASLAVEFHRDAQERLAQDTAKAMSVSIQWARSFVNELSRQVGPMEAAAAADRQMAATRVQAGKDIEASLKAQSAALNEALQGEFAMTEATGNIIASLKQEAEARMEAARQTELSEQRIRVALQQSEDAMRGEVDSATASANEIIQARERIASSMMSGMNPMRAATQAFNQTLAATGNYTQAARAGMAAFGNNANTTAAQVRKMGMDLNLSSKAIKELERQAMSAGIRVEDLMRKMMGTSQASKQMRDSFDKTNSMLGRVGAVFAGLFVISRITDWAKQFVTDLIGITKEAATLEAASRKLIVISDNLGVAHTDTGKAVQSLTSGFLNQQTAVSGLATLLKSGLPLEQATKQMKQFEESVLGTSGAMKVNENVLVALEAFMDRQSRSVGKRSGMQTNFGQALRMSTKELDLLNVALGTNIQANTLAGEATRWSIALGKEFSTVMGIQAAVTNTTTGQLALLDKNVTNVKLALGTQLLPIMGAFLRIINQTIPSISEWIVANGNLIRAIVLTTGTVAVLTAVLGTLAIAVISVAFAFNIAMWSGWTVVILGAITALGALLPALIGPEKALRSMIRTIGATIGFIIGFIKALWDSRKAIIAWVGIFGSVYMIANFTKIVMAVWTLIKAMKILAIVSALAQVMMVIPFPLNLIAAATAIYGIEMLLKKAFESAAGGADLFEGKLNEAFDAMKDFSGGTGDNSAMLTNFGKSASDAYKGVGDELKKMVSLAEKARKATVDLFSAMLDYKEQISGIVVTSFFDPQSFDRQVADFDTKFKKIQRTIQDQIDKSEHSYGLLQGSLTGPQDTLAKAILDTESAFDRANSASTSFANNAVAGMKRVSKEAEQASAALKTTGWKTIQKQPKQAPLDWAALRTTGWKTIQKQPKQAPLDWASLANTDGNKKAVKAIQAGKDAIEAAQQPIKKAAKAPLPAVDLKVQADKDQIKTAKDDIQKALDAGRKAQVEVGLSERMLSEARSAIAELDKLQEVARKQFIEKTFDEQLSKMSDYENLSLETQKIVGEAEARRIARTMQAQLEGIEEYVVLYPQFEKRAADLRVSIQKEANYRILYAQSELFRFMTKEIEDLSSSIIDGLVEATDIVARNRESAQRTSDIQAARVRRMELELEIRESNATEIEKAAMRIAAERDLQLEIQNINAQSTNVLLNIWQQFYNSLRREFFSQVISALSRELVDGIAKAMSKAGGFLLDAKGEIEMGRETLTRLEALTEALKPMTQLETTETVLIESLNQLTDSIRSLQGLPALERQGAGGAAGGADTQTGSSTGGLPPAFPGVTLPDIGDGGGDSVSGVASAAAEISDALYNVTDDMQKLAAGLVAVNLLLGDDTPKIIKDFTKWVGLATAILTILRAVGLIKAALDTHQIKVTAATTVAVAKMGASAWAASRALDAVAKNARGGGGGAVGTIIDVATGGGGGDEGEYYDGKKWEKRPASASSQLAAAGRGLTGRGTSASITTQSGQGQTTIQITIPVNASGQEFADEMAEEIHKVASAAAIRVVKRHSIGIGGSV